VKCAGKPRRWEKIVKVVRLCTQDKWSKRKFGVGSSDFRDHQENIHLEGEDSGIRKHEAVSTKMLLLKNFGSAVGRHLPVMPKQ